MTRNGSSAQIPLLKANRKGDRTFTARLAGDGIYVSNLLDQSFLPWEVFTETIALLERSGGRTKKGDAMGSKLGETGLPIDSVEGWIAYKVYKRNIGETVFRRITPIACILIWAKICISQQGELILCNSQS